MANGSPVTHQTLRQQGGTGEDSYIHLAGWTLSVAAMEKKKKKKKPCSYADGRLCRMAVFVTSRHVTSRHVRVELAYKTVRRRYNILLIRRLYRLIPTTVTLEFGVSRQINVGVCHPADKDPYRSEHRVRKRSSVGPGGGCGGGGGVGGEVPR